MQFCELHRNRPAADSGLPRRLGDSQVLPETVTMAGAEKSRGGGGSPRVNCWMPDCEECCRSVAGVLQECSVAAGVGAAGNLGLATGNPVRGWRRVM